MSDPLSDKELAEIDSKVRSLKRLQSGILYCGSNVWAVADCVERLVPRLLAEVRRLRELRNADHRGWTCNGCGVPWSPEIETEACDHSHRSHWAHEWVSPLVGELQQKIVELLAQNERLATNVDQLECTLDDEEAAHQETLRLLQESRAEVARLRAENERLKSIVEWEGVEYE